MIGRPPATARGGSALTLALLLLTATTFGLVGGLTDFVGATVAVSGVLASAAWRRWRSDSGRTWAVVPTIAALLVLAVTSPAVPAAELLGGLASLALLLWLADDPAGPAGGGRRAAPGIAFCAAAVGVAWAVALLLPSAPPVIGVAGGLLAFVVLLLAVLLERASLAPSGRNATD